MYIRVNIAFRRVDTVHELDGFNYPHFADSIWIAPRTLTVARQIVDESETAGFFDRPVMTAVQYYLVKGRAWLLALPRLHTPSASDSERVAKGRRVGRTPSTGLRHPLEEGAGKRCSRSRSERRFPAPSSELCQNWLRHCRGTPHS